MIPLEHPTALGNPKVPTGAPAVTAGPAVSWLEREGEEKGEREREATREEA